jgi:hypothetical protein
MPRDIEVKTLLNSDEFSELKQECKTADVKHGPLLRTLAKAWVAEQKDKRRQTKRPESGLVPQPRRTSDAAHASLRPGHGNSQPPIRAAR